MALNSSRMGGKAPSKGRRDGDLAALYGQPPAEGFELDPKTGHFFNKETQQYYESATSLYYTFKDGQCYYFDNNTQQYAPCIGIGNPSAPRTDPEALGVPKAKKKSKAAALGTKKKAAKDMASWAQAAENADAPVQQGEPLPGNAPAPGAANMASFKFEITNFNPEPPKKKKEAKKPAAAAPAAPSDALPPPPSAAATAIAQAAARSAPAPAASSPKPTQFICYLCNRKFNSQEMLTKHENMSDLHKKNLALATMKEKKRQ